MMKVKPIQVMIVDDHLMVRRGLATFLLASDDMELVGEAGNGPEAIARCQEVKPDVVLMDMVMPGMDGAQVTKAILDHCPKVRVIALTSYQDESMVQNAFAAGAISYLLKNVTEEDLADAIRSAVAGRPTLAPEATQALMHVASHPSKPGDNLTKRELQVLPLMVEGLSNSQIADRLVISPSTVRFHVGNILTKLSAANRAEAVAVALRHKLVN